MLAFPLEAKLYRSAVQNLDPNCLVVLLDAGCRSPVICEIAAQEGKEALLVLAALRGCPCSFQAMEIAARLRNPSLVRAACKLAVAFNDPFWSCWTQKERRLKVRQDLKLVLLSIDAAATRGDTGCLEAVFANFPEICGWPMYHDTTTNRRYFTERLLFRLGYSCFDMAARRSEFLGFVRWLRNDMSFPMTVLNLARDGHLECLGLLRRMGWRDFGPAACAAAKGGHLQCMQFLLEAGLGSTDGWRPVLVHYAAMSENLDCLSFLIQCGAWQSVQIYFASFASYWSAAALRSYLGVLPDPNWEMLMRTAIIRHSPKHMLALYENGFEQWRAGHMEQHPACTSCGELALHGASLEKERGARRPPVQAV
eukprot:jgi/Botrbrau1/19029/Bobra.0100s0057.1